MKAAIMLMLVAILFVGSANALNSSGVFVAVSTLPQQTSANPVSYGSSSGGSGGGGVVTDEPYINIESSDRKELDLHSGQTASYQFNSIVYRIDINAQNNEDSVTAKVEVLKDKSLKTTAPNHNSIKFFNAYVGTQRFSSATIYFTTDKLPAVLLRWNPTTKQWAELETTTIDDSHYSAKTTGFSNFAIVLKETPPAQNEPGIIQEPIGTPITEITTTEATSTPEATTTPQMPGFTGIVAVIGTLTMAMYIRRK